MNSRPNSNHPESQSVTYFKSEEWFRLLFEKSAEAHILVDNDKIIDCNDAAVLMFGCNDKAQLLMCRPMAISPEYQPDGRFSEEMARKHYAVACDQGSSCFTWTYLKISGEEFPVEVTLASIPLDGKKMVLGVLRDLAQSLDKTDKQARQESQDRVAALVEAIPDILYRVNRDGVCLEYMADGKPHALLAAAECVGKNLSEVLPSEVAESTLNAVQAAIRTRQLQSFEYELSVHGEKRYRDGRVVAQSEEEALVIVRDITERKQADLLLRKERERLAAVIATQQEIVSAEHDLNTVMRVIVERSRQITGADGGVIEFIEGDEMAYRAVSGTASAHLGLRIKANSSLSGQCVRENTVLRSDDTESDSRVDQEACRRIGLRSMIVVPLNHDRVTIGALKVLSNRPHAFSELDIVTLQLMAGVIAAAVSDVTAFDIKQTMLAERAQAMEVIQKSEERFRAATEGSLDSFFLLESVRDAASNIEDFVFVDMNARAEWMLTRPREQVLGQRLCELIPINRTGGFFEKYVQVVETGETLVEEFQLYAEEIDAVWIQHQVVKVNDGIAITSRDISERKQAEQQILDQQVQLRNANSQLEQHLAFISKQRTELENQKTELEIAIAKLESLATTDGLTGLKNHRAFQQRLAEVFLRSQRYRSALSILLLDVDSFKQFNDTFGHPMGDEVLKTVAAIMYATARETDFVARYGGEEFVVLLPHTDASEAVGFAEQIRAAIESQPWERRKITISIGVSTRRSTTQTAQQMIDEADKALYASKIAGRNRVTHIENTKFPGA